MDAVQSAPLRNRWFPPCGDPEIGQLIILKGLQPVGSCNPRYLRRKDTGSTSLFRLRNSAYGRDRQSFQVVLSVPSPAVAELARLKRDSPCPRRARASQNVRLPLR